jgi:predicted aconitase
VKPDLADDEQAMLDGSHGPAMALAMDLVVKAATIMKAPHLVAISFAHLDACFYTGQSHVDFARYLTENGAKLAVPTWTNNGVVSLDQPGLKPEAADPGMVRGAAEVMRLYAGLGCKPTWTCAPYQLPGGPKFGDHIAVGESNAVAYYNSAVGCRTNKYGDYLDVACALTGKAPFAGLHTDQGRKASIAFDCAGLSDAMRRNDLFPHLLGTFVGRMAGRRIPAITRLSPDTGPDALKALSAAAAAAGGVELWHGVGVTPEAPDLDAVFEGHERVVVTPDDVIAAHRALSTANDGPLDAVALGTPHFSVTEFRDLLRLLDGRSVSKGLPVLVSTSRGVREVITGAGWLAPLEAAGITVVVDLCTYYAPRVPAIRGRVMTNAAKWAYYAPGMLGVEVALGSLAECVESAVAGEVRRESSLWGAP